MFSIKNGVKQEYDLAQLLFNFALHYAIWRVQVNPDGLKLNGTHQLLVYTDGINILGGSVHIVKKNTGTLVDSNSRLVVNADKTEYLIVSRDQNSGQSHRTKNDNCSFERVEVFKYLGTTLTNQNSIQEEIKSRLKKSGNACYHSVQNFLSSILLSNNIGLKKNITIILPVVLCGCETWSLTLREEHRLGVFENRVLRRIFVPKCDEVTREQRKLHNEELNDLYSSLNIVRVIKSRRMRWVGLVARVGERRVQGFGGET